LKINKPLVFFDIESTGLDITKDKIIEITILKLSISGRKNTFTFRINPEIPIPSENSKIHGIYDKDVKNSPSFKKVGNKIKKLLYKCDLVGFNILKFDLPILIEEFKNNKISFSINNINIIDVQKLYHLMEKRNLSSAYKFYCNKTLKNSHSSFSDTMATYEIFLNQLKKYDNQEVFDLKGNKMGKISKNLNKINNTLNNNMIDLEGRFIMDNEDPVFNFGKYKGKKIKEILKKNPGYFNWIIKGKFSNDTKENLKKIKKRK
tara:strand:- start:3403 stop:4188 length:786 start_codon:yes stop_codon:yes gene_type:complete